MGSLAARLPGCVDFSANCSLGDSRCSEGRWVDLSMEGGFAGRVGPRGQVAKELSTLSKSG